MCNNIDDDLSIEELEGRYGRRPKRQMKLDFGDFKFTRRKKGVDLPKVMIITSAEPDLIQPYNWGKFKPWPGKPFSPVSFLNARIETIAQLPTWKPIQNNRCLIPVQGFMNISTWIKMESRIHWVKKQNYFTLILRTKALSLWAGYGTIGVDEATGEEIKCFTMLTKEAIGLVKEIHNSKPRMPIILNSDEEEEWLMGAPQTLELELEAHPV